MDFSDLKGKVAIVTGGSKGIGRATALAFAREGVSVAIIDTDVENGSKVALEIEELQDEGPGLDGVGPGLGIFIPADVSKDGDAQRSVAETVQAFGRLDILHNNAGIQTYGTVVTTDEATWDKTLAVNVKSIYLMSKYAIPHLITAGGGAIVNTASIQAVASLANCAAYVASKGAVMALTREMALDFAANNIRVNAVLPGSVNTPMLQFAASQEAEPDKAFDEWGKQHVLGRIGTPEEVANLVIFLSSRAASFITGAPYFVDGGLAARLF